MFLLAFAPYINRCCFNLRVSGRAKRLDQMKWCWLDVAWGAELVPALPICCPCSENSSSQGSPSLGTELESSFIYGNAIQMNITCIYLEMQVSRANNRGTN